MLTSAVGRNYFSCRFSHFYIILKIPILYDSNFVQFVTYLIIAWCNGVQNLKTFMDYLESQNTCASTC